MADEPTPQSHATLTARLDERTKTVFTRLEKHEGIHEDLERRMRSLEQWRAWILGAAAVITVAGNFAFYTLQSWFGS